jgi:apoptosis-inducing factor 2
MQLMMCSQNKPVTIVQGGDALLNKTYPDKFRTRAGTNVTDRGVDIVYNDYIDEFSSDFAAPEGYVTTRHGKQIKTDLVVPTRGGRPNTGFLKGSEIPINEYGQIRVEDTLQIKGFRNVFAAGDATDILEQKQAAKYKTHTAVVVANILSLLSGAEPSKTYKPSMEMIVITNGKVCAIAMIS